MIVQCDQCNAKFRLDDSKVKEGGVKVRCSKCKNIFIVRSETPAEEADFDSFLSGLMPPSPGEAKEPPQTASAAEPPGSQATDIGQPSRMESPAVGEEPVSSSEIPGHEDFDLSGFTFNEQEYSSEPAPVAAKEGTGRPEEGLVFGELDFGKNEPSEHILESPGRGAEKLAHEEFVFKDEPAPSVPELELNIEGLDMFGETEVTGTPGAATSPKPQEHFLTDSSEGFSFEPEPSEKEAPKADEGFIAGSSEEFSLEPESTELKTVPLGTEEEKEPEQTAPFDFGEFEFGEAAVSEKDETDKQKPESWDLGQPEETAYAKISAPSLPEMPSFEDEPPPLSISSRRRGGSILPIAVTAISVLLVLALAGGGFYFFKEGPSAFNKLGLGFMAKWFGVESREEGSIAVRNTAGIFLNNSEAGEIFAINGEVVNNFGKPRASIQVKATLYGPKGAVLLQKTAYCGNVLSREQLAALPVAKLEAAMSNQFGDSLSNLAVQPGKGIPFVIVLTNVPKEVAEFGVEIVGSTVATQ